MIIYNGAIPASLLFIFALFNQIVPFLQEINKKMSIHYLALEFKLTTSWYESPPLTARPGLPPTASKGFGNTLNDYVNYTIR